MKRDLLIVYTLCSLFFSSWSKGWASTDSPEIEQANTLLGEVSRVYSELPAFVDEMTTNFQMDGRPDDKSTIKVRFSRDAIEATGMVPPQTLDVYAINGQLSLQLKGVEGVVQAELGDDPIASARRVMGIAYPYLPPQVMLRWTQGIDHAGEWFTLGLLNDAIVTGYAEVVDGETMRSEVRFTGVAPLLDGRPGTCRVQFDFKTKLISNIVIMGGTDGLSPSFLMTANFHPKTPDQLDDPIVFDVKDDLTRFANFKSLLSVLLGGGVSVDPSIRVGAKAPDFELIDQSGKRHALSEYRGKLILLDWWGSWCGPCRRDLPKTQALHEQFANNTNLVILAMNVGDDNEKMSEFWAENGYTFPTLNDADELAGLYGVKAYPSVVLIGPDGVILHTEAGSASDIEETIFKALDSMN